MKNNKMKIFIGIIIATLILLIISIFRPFLTPTRIAYPNKSGDGTIDYVNASKVVSQKFISKLDRIDSISFYIGTYGKNIKKGNIIFKIYNEGNLIYLNKRSFKDIYDGTNLVLNFEPQNNSKGKLMEVVMEFEGMKKDEYVAFFKPEYNQFDNNNVMEDPFEIQCDGVALNDCTINISQSGETGTPFYTLIILGILLIEVFIYYFIKFRKMDYKNKYPKLYNVVMIILSFVMAYTLVDTYMDIFYENRISMITFPMLLISSIIVIRNIAINLGKGKQIEKLFLALAIPLGMLYTICVVPGSVPDEAFHLAEVETLANGKVFARIGTKREIKNNNSYYLVKQHVTKEYSEEYVKSKAGMIYAKILYAVPAVGMAIGKLFGLSLSASQYLAVIANYIFFLVVGYYIIKLLPFGKYMGVVYLLSPMNLQQMTSVSCDAMINASCLLFIAYVLKLKYDKLPLTIKNAIILGILIFMVLISKLAYFPLLLLLFLLKDNIKKSDKKELKKIILPIVISLVAFGTWYICKNYVNVSHSSEEVIEYINGVKIPQKNLDRFGYLMTNPFRAIYIFINTIFLQDNRYFFTTIGHLLGALNIWVPEYICTIYFILLLMSVFFDENKLKLIEKKRIIGICFLNFCVILAGIFLGWTPYRSTYVSGVQGRYFIPFVILLFLILKNDKIKINIKNKNLVIASVLLFVNMSAIIRVIMYFLR